ncbi:MAG: hypothetical protein IPO39_02595 [Bacteroidetes bacterium]|nr:hypothetical protein [Bacteroidota bacterium]MBP6401379.1 hypothetical protein [Bacteroidia bacterium]MBP6648159.1 hypothetical protein [Bacteroidia bacterium]
MTKMKRFTSILRLFILIGLTAATFSSCVKKEYDEPDTANMDPTDLVVTHTLDQFQNLATGPIPVLITTDIILSGIVIADDESGNFYKEIIIQDSTGGLSISVDISNFYTEYPVGRRLFVKAKGLYLADDGDGNFQIGVKDNNTIGRIPSTLVGQYVVKGKWGIPVTPLSYTLSSLGNAPSNVLVKISGVEFVTADAGISYADAINLISKNRVVEDCSTPANTVKMYNSGYSKFAAEITPSGNGTIVCVNKYYNGNPELIIRDPRDVVMNDIRCDGTTGALTQMPIDSLRMLYTGATTTCPTGRKIKGIVISDLVNKNIDPKNMVIQDGNAGIVVRFTAAHTFAMGAEVEVRVSGQELSEYNGLLEVNYVDLGNAVQTGTGTITPRVATVTAILANLQAWESTLITVQAATASGSTSYSGSNTLNDGTGAMTLYTRSLATFSASALPAGPMSYTGFLSEYTGSSAVPAQLSIRTLSDVQ